MKLTPLSIAACNARIDSSSSTAPQKPPIAQAPKPIADTRMSVRPSCRYCIRSEYYPRMRSRNRMRAAVAAALMLLVGTPSVAQRLRPADVEKLPSKPADTRIPYGEDGQQFGELRLPKGNGPFPLAIVIHGGCWLSRWTLTNTAPLADALRDAGVATWNLEYRRVDHPGGGWPGTFTDIADGTDVVRRIAREHPIDLTRVVTIGHSAGAHL